jgi:DNA repair protein RadC
MMSVKEMPESEQPRMKAKNFGIRSLSTAELLAILLRTGRRGKTAVETADELLKKAGGTVQLAKMELKELCQIKGIGEVKALQIVAAFELSRRCAYEETRHKDVIEDAGCLVDWLKKEIGNEVQEEFLVVYLDSQHRIISYEILFKGTIDASMVYPREVFRQALLYNSTSIMLVHNHPGGNVMPSDQDLFVTARLIRAGRLFHIDVLDHLIVSGNDCCSFRREGLLPMAPDQDQC